LGNFKGAGQNIEAHLEKFKIAAKYYGWNAEDKLSHLQNRLDGAAANVLFELKDDSTEADLVALLKARFGTKDQIERFRYEVKTRLRNKDKSTQTLYQDICLLSLGYPGETGTLREVVGKGCFLYGLNDSVMRTKLLEREPLFLDAMVNLAIRFESYALADAHSETPAEETSHRRSRAAASRPPADASLQDRIRNLRAELKRLQSRPAHGNYGG
jgi:hypothetical protein